MEEDIREVIYEYSTGYCSTKNKALKMINFDEINDCLDKTNLVRDIKAEVEDLIDFIECIFDKKGEASNKGICVIHNNKGWKIEIVIRA